MDSPARIIRKQLKVLEDWAAPLEVLREAAKTDGGRLTAYGREFIALNKRHGVRQVDVAKMLDITPGAVSQHYNK
jgi:hypothetical protein